MPILLGYSSVLKCHCISKVISDCCFLSTSCPITWIVDWPASFFYIKTVWLPNELPNELIVPKYPGNLFLFCKLTSLTNSSKLWTSWRFVDLGLITLEPLCSSGLLVIPSLSTYYPFFIYLFVSLPMLYTFLFPFNGQLKECTCRYIKWLWRWRLFVVIYGRPPRFLDIFHVNGWEVNRHVHDLNVLTNNLRSGLDYVEDETDLDMRDVIIRIASLAWTYSTLSTALVA